MEQNAINSVKIDTFFYHRKLTREWACRFTPSELSVLYYIFDRTLGWQKWMEIIKINHITEGIFDRAGNEIQCGLNIGRTTVKQAINRLIEEGYLIVQKLKNGARRMGINFKRDEMLKIPKKPKEKAAGLRVSNKKKGGSNSVPHKNKNINSSLSKDNKELKSSSEPSGNIDQEKYNSAVSELKELQKVISKKTWDKKQKKLEKHRNKPTASGMSYLWSVAVKQAYPENKTVVWTMKEMGQVKNFINSSSDMDVPDFLEFCVKHWNYIRDTKFKYAEKRGISVPSYPSIGFIMGFKSSFLDAYADRVRATQESKMSFEEQKITEYMRNKAVDRDTAKAWFTDKFDRKNNEQIEKYKREIRVLNRQNEELAEENKKVKTVHVYSKEELKDRKRRVLSAENETSFKLTEPDLSILDTDLTDLVWSDDE